MAAPGVPTGLTLCWADGKVTLEWTAPNDKDLTGYVVKRGAKADDLAETPDQPSGTSTSFEDKDAPSQAEAYRLWYAVAAKNADVPGPFMDAKPVDVPKIVRLKVSAKLYAGLTIGWLAAVIGVRLVIGIWFPSANDVPYVVAGMVDTPAGAFGHQLLVTASRLSVELAAWGIALLVVAFVPVALLSILQSIDFTSGSGDRPQGEELFGVTLPDVPAVLKATGDLLKTPAGFGGLLVAMSIVLLALALYSPPANPSPGASPAPSSPSASGSQAPASGSPPAESLAPVESAAPST